MTLLIGACSQSEPQAAWVDGVARFPDDQGLATDVTFERIRLDDERSYEVPRDIESFSTYNGDIVPLVQLEGRYIQIGLREGAVVEWVASIGVIQEGDPATVVYVGIVEEVEGKDVIFQDGTVLQLSGAVDDPEVGERYKVTVHVGKKQVMELTPQ